MDSGLRIESAIAPTRLPELTDLMRTAWWMNDRTPSDVAGLLEHSDLVIAVISRATDRLAGFARVLTDYAYVALVLDVIVDESQRGTGVGAVLLDAVVNHPELARVRSLELVCQPALVPFYRRWGFTDAVGGSRLMRRSADERLVGPTAC